MIRLYLVSMFLIPALDAFDRWFERYGVKVGAGEWFEDKAIVFGTFTDVRVGGVRKRLRFIRIRLPIHTWGPDLMRHEYGWLTHHLTWIEERPQTPYEKSFFGWSIYPPIGE